MSYVLEALKKQEAENDPDAAVALSLATQRHRRHRRLGTLLWIALGINLSVLAALVLWPGGLLEWVQRSSNPPMMTKLEAAPEAAPGVAPGVAPGAAFANRAGPPSPAAVEPASTMPRGEPSTPTDAAIPAGSAAAEAVAAVPKEPAPAPQANATRRAEPPPARPRTPATPVSLDELPASVRARFPGIVFSTHIYADDHDLRAVVANGQRLAEGDRLGKVKVSEITETGVILGFEDYLVSVPVVGFWDSP